MSNLWFNSEGEQLELDQERLGSDAKSGEHTPMTDEMVRFGEMMMSRWNRSNDKEVQTELHETIEAASTLFPDADVSQLAQIGSFAHGCCHDDEVRAILYRVNHE